MTSLSVIVAAYGTSDAARADWRQVAREGGADVLDGVLIERIDTRVVAIEPFAGAGWGAGTISGALIGHLWPPSLLDGAVAGGVGGRMLTAVSRGLSRDATHELGRVMEAGRFVTLAVIDRGGSDTPCFFGGRTLQLAVLPMAGTARQLRSAFDLDRFDE